MRKPAEKKNFLYTLFCWVFAAVFAGIWLGTIVNNRTSYYQYQVVPILACGGAALLVLVGAWRLWKRWAFSLPPKKEAALVAGLLAAYFAVQLGFSFLMQVSASPTWDFGIVFSAAREYVLNGTMPGEYFTQFHNNAPMYLFLVAFFKLLHLFGVENFMPFALVLNNLLINASLLALYWALRQLYGAKNALFGLMGSFLFAKVLGLENNIYLQTGVIMLIGLLAKTAILITEYATERRRKGMGIIEAAYSAAQVRFRPILMTVLTMIFGMLPLMFATGAGANGNSSLGTGVVGGMLIGTLALLFITPVFFIVFQYLQEKVRPPLHEEADAQVLAERQKSLEERSAFKSEKDEQ